MMKKKTFAMLATILCCGLLMTSCKDDDNNNVTPEQPEQPEQPVQPEAKLIQPENQFETKVAAISGDPQLEAALKAIPGVTDLKCFNNVNMGTTYFFNFEQDIDHKNPSLGKFKQQVLLKYVGKDAHTVLHTEGYALAGEPDKNVNRLDSVNPPYMVHTYETNCVIVEHRYHGWSLPEGYTNSFKYLNTWQQSTDLHCIVTALKASGLFPKKWVSTGVSKNGETTAFYAYHYPNEMDAYVPFCGPYLTSLTDPRVGDYMLNAADLKPELEKIKAAFRHVASNEQLRNELLARFIKDFPAIAKDKTADQLYIDFIASIYTYLYDKEAYVHVSKWRDYIPTANSTVEQFYWFLMANADTQYPDDTPQEQAARHAMKVNDSHRLLTDRHLITRSNDSNDAAQRFDPYTVQTCIDMGNYVYNYSWLKDLLTADQWKKLGKVVFTPEQFGVTYDGGKFIKEFLKGMETTPCKMLFVYGSADPWTGAALPDPANPNVQKLIVYLGTHTDVTTYWTTEDEQTLKNFLDPIIGK